MKDIVKLVAIVVSGSFLTACDNSTEQHNSKATPESATRSAKEIRGATPYIELRDEPPPKLIVDPPLPDLLDQGVVWIQWRVENIHIASVFGKGALQASPRLGHLHVQVDELPWWWADASDINTIDLAGLPPGPHKILITLVNANHEPFAGQSKLVTFTIGGGSKTTSAVQSTNKKVASCG